MFLAAGVGAFGSGIFHVVTHAFFKALLFLGSGSIILALHHEQDLFRMGGLKKYLPITFWTMWVATLAISGVPPLAGFFSKDAILWNAFSLGHVVLWIIGVAVAGLTAFYMFRLMFLAFYGEEAAPGSEHNEQGNHRPHEPSLLITGPLMILAVFSALAGFLGLPGYLGTNLLETFLEPSFRYRYFGEHAAAHAYSLEIVLTVIAILAAAAGIAVAYYAYIRDRGLPGRLAQRFQGLYLAARQKFYVDEIYDAILVRPIQRISDVFLWRVIDEGLIDGIVNGTGELMQYWGSALRRIQSGYTRGYATWILIGALLLFIYYYLVTV